MNAAEKLSHEIGTVIRKQRNLRGLNQTQLAQLAGVSLNLISQIEKGKPRVQFAKILQILTVLGLQFKIEVGAAGLIIDKKLNGQ
jgi:y4mF family transcriptional regulator